jgi:DNA-binding LacI/PurR family transcriptional regulator
MTAMSAMRPLEKRGKKIPDDTMIAGFGNPSEMTLFSRLTAGVDRPIDDICRAALNLMVERRADPRKSASRITFPGTLVTGELASVAPQKPARATGC